MASTMGGQLQMSGSIEQSAQIHATFELNKYPIIETSATYMIIYSAFGMSWWNSQIEIRAWIKTKISLRWWWALEYNILTTEYRLSERALAKQTEKPKIISLIRLSISVMISYLKRFQNMTKTNAINKFQFNKLLHFIYGCGGIFQQSNRRERISNFDR